MPGRIERMLRQALRAGHAARAAVSRRVRSWRCLEWGVSGGREDVLEAAGPPHPPRSATPVVTPPTRPTARSATGLTGHTEVGARGVRSGGGELRRPAEESSGRITTRRRGCGRGNDAGTQYRSAIYTSGAAQTARRRDRARQLSGDAGRGRGYGDITTEIAPAPEYFYAEDYHQQYLHKNPDGYCGIGGTGVSCPIGGQIPSSNLMCSDRRRRRPERAR